MYDHLNRMLTKHNINSIRLPQMISSFLRPANDNLGLKTPSVYSKSCECGHVYMKQTGQSRHQGTGASIQPRPSYKPLETKILSTKSDYIDYFIKKAIELELHPNNMNMGDVLA
jgi:hypothetical protein